VHTASTNATAGRQANARSLRLRKAGKSTELIPLLANLSANNIARDSDLKKNRARFVRGAVFCFENFF
jgi:hypothetical protein